MQYNRSQSLCWKRPPKYNRAIRNIYLGIWYAICLPREDVSCNHTENSNSNTNSQQSAARFRGNSQVILNDGIRWQKYIINHDFLHDRPWISPWYKSISNEWDIIIHLIASQLSGHCDVISNRLWRHQQNENRASETRGIVKIIVFIVTYGFLMSCKK